MKVDLLAIGGGFAGMVSARRAAELGLSVAGGLTWPEFVGGDVLRLFPRVRAGARAEARAGAGAGAGAGADDGGGVGDGDGNAEDGFAAELRRRYVGVCASQA